MLVTLTAPFRILFVIFLANSIELKEEKNHMNAAKITLRVTGSRLFLPQFTFHYLVRITMQILSLFNSRPLCSTYATNVRLRFDIQRVVVGDIKSLSNCLSLVPGSLRFVVFLQTQP